MLGCKYFVEIFLCVRACVIFGRGGGTLVFVCFRYGTPVVDPADNPNSPNPTTHVQNTPAYPRENNKTPTIHTTPPNNSQKISNKIPE